MVDDLIDVLDGILVKAHSRLLLLLIRIVTVHEVSGALDPGIGQLAYLLAVVAVPPPPVELLMELEDKLGMNEVGKPIAHITSVVGVNRQVEEVNLLTVFFAYFLQKHFF